MSFDTRVHFRDKKSGKLEPDKSRPYQKLVRRSGGGGVEEVYIRDGKRYYSNGEEIKAKPKNTAPAKIERRKSARKELPVEELPTAADLPSAEEIVQAPAEPVDQNTAALAEAEAIMNEQNAQPADVSDDFGAASQHWVEPEDKSEDSTAS